jgi:FkbM family methyltransferase
MEIVMGLRKILFRCRWELLRPQPFQARYFGYRLVYEPNDHLVSRYAAVGTYEEEVIAFLKRAMRPDSVVFDIGANIGMFALAVARIAPNASIHCFEPSPIPRRCLQLSIELNDLSSRVWVNPSAVGADEGEKYFCLHAKGESAFDGLHDTGRADAVQTIRVPVTTIDAYVTKAGLARLDLMKIDTEGAEIFVLQGARQTLHAFRPVIIFEANRLNFESYKIHPQELERLLHVAGYHIVTISGKSVKYNSLQAAMENGEEFAAIPDFAE